METWCDDGTGGDAAFPGDIFEIEAFYGVLFSEDEGYLTTLPLYL